MDVVRTESGKCRLTESGLFAVVNLSTVTDAEDPYANLLFLNRGKRRGRLRRDVAIGRLFPPRSGRAMLLGSSAVETRSRRYLRIRFCIGGSRRSSSAKAAGSNSIDQAKPLLHLVDRDSGEVFLESA